MTWEEAVIHFQKNASKELIEQCYFHPKPIDAARTFEKSREFKDSLALVNSKKGGKLLDIGAGNGIASFAFAQNEFSVFALEPDSSLIIGSGAIRSLNDYLKNPINVFEEFGESLPFENNFFDVVYCRQVLHHARDLTQFLKEIGRVLKKGGLVLTLRDHVISKPEDLQAFLNRHPLHKFYGGENAFLLTDYENAFINSGLKIKSKFSPLSSIFNYFPETEESVKMKIRGLLKSDMNQIEYYLSRFMSAQNIISKYGDRASERLNDPGRLYSYLLEKAE